MHVQRPGADFFPGFLDGFPGTEDVGDEPERERDAPGCAETFGGETGEARHEAATRLEGDGAPFVRAVRVTRGHRGRGRGPGGRGRRARARRGRGGVRVGGGRTSASGGPANARSGWPWSRSAFR